MDKFDLGNRVKQFIKAVFKEQEKHWKDKESIAYTHGLLSSETHQKNLVKQEKLLRLNEKELDKILKEFYEHMCGVDDYGCNLCLKYKQDILDLQGEK